MTNLKDVQVGLNRYCGPAFLSALTGKDTDECARILSEVSGKREIKAVEVGYLLKALDRMRFKAEREKLFHNSLYGNLTQLAKRDGIYMIVVPHHVVGVEVKENKIYLVDNHTLTPIDASASARLTQRVEQAYKIVPKPEKIYVRTELVVSERNGYIDIKANEIFECEEDNQEVNLGYVRVRNDIEFTKILLKLTDIGGRK